MGRSLIRETVTTGAVTTPTQAGSRWHARIIEGDRWGSSGYYPREVLERDGATAWPAGTPVYIDHPGESEMFDRPERSIRDLAGKITTDPVYESDGLYADRLLAARASSCCALWSREETSSTASGSLLCRSGGTAARYRLSTATSLS